MEQYIPKSAIVSEIERRKKYYENIQMIKPVYESNIEDFNELLSFLDTLEVKEVKKETVSDDLEEAIGQSFVYHESHGDDFRSDKQIKTAYIRGFETGAKWADKHSIEVKEVDLNKEIKDYFDNQPTITKSKGVDYQLIPSGEDIAKYFFGLGMAVSNKAQKGE